MSIGTSGEQGGGELAPDAGDGGIVGTEHLDAHVVGTGVVVGFYDGALGPGTGSFLIFFLIGLLGYDFLMASAAAKVLDLGSNITAMSYFAGSGQVLWKVGLPMAACNVLGAQLGTRMAVKRGVGFVRPLFLLMVSAAILRLSWDTLRD